MNLDWDIDDVHTCYYNKKGLYHRLDGPALVYSNGDACWLVNGELHREDGPAIEYADGDKEWYYHAKCIDCENNEEFLKIIKLRMFW